MQIVADFMNEGIVSIGSDSLLVDVIALMKEKTIGAILIEENNKTLGIFTERDLLTKIDYTNPSKLPALKIKDVMTSNLKTVDYNEPYTNVIDLMRLYKIRHTPVKKRGRVVGMVSLRDLLTHYEEYLKQIIKDNNNKLLETLDRIKETEERYRSVFNNSSVAITVTDKDEKIVAWNPYAATLLGMNNNELLNLPVRDLYLPKEWKRIRSLNIRKMGMTHHMETQVFNKRKELIDVDITINVLKNAKGKVTGSIGIMTDISERRKSEEELLKYRLHLEELVESRTEELKKVQSQLMQAEKMRVVGGLATGVAHEVKNPLMIIQQGVAYLGKVAGTENKDVRLALKHLKSAVKRADKIISSLLDFASITELSIKKINVNEVLEEALDFIKHHITKSNIEVKKEFGENLPEIEIDINKMEQVFIDLFLNAVSAMGRQGQLTVRTYLKDFIDFDDGVGRRTTDSFKLGDKGVVIEIEDMGTGIPQDILDKIYDPFFTTKRAKGGTGLGLSVVKNIVTLHGGNMKIENREDASGAKVTVMLRLEAKTPYAA